MQESAGVRMDCVTAHKQGLEQIAVGDWGGDMVEDVLEDFIILPSQAPEVASPVNAEVILCRDAGRPQRGAGQFTMSRTPLRSKCHSHHTKLKRLSSTVLLT